MSLLCLYLTIVSALFLFYFLRFALHSVCCMERVKLCLKTFFKTITSASGCLQSIRVDRAYIIVRIWLGSENVCITKNHCVQMKEQCHWPIIQCAYFFCLHLKISSLLFWFVHTPRSSRAQLWLFCFFHFMVHLEKRSSLEIRRI